MVVNIRYFFQKTINNRWLPLIVAGIGVVVRLLYYFSDRSLWLDEATMAMAVIDTPWKTIFMPYYKDMPAVAPVGYVVLTKLLTSFFGISELVLRLISVVCGVASVIFFWNYLKSNFNKTVTLVALFFFSINPNLIYYSTEVKFYAVDVMMTILLFSMFSKCFKTKNVRDWMALTLLVIIMQWFSYVTIIVSAGLFAAGVISQAIGPKKILPDINLVISGVVTGIHFWVYKLLFIDAFSNGQQLNNFWYCAYAPLPLSLDAFSWYVMFIKKFMEIPGGFQHVEFFSFTVFLSGIYVCYKKKPFVWISVSAILCVSYCISLLKMYPVYARLGLFLVPVILVCIACGLDCFIKKGRWGRAAGVVCLLVLSCVPAIGVLRNVWSPLRPEHIKPLVKRIAYSASGDECIYVYNGAVAAFEYYTKVYSMNRTWIAGRRERDRFDDDIQDIIDKNNNTSHVWLLFSHVHSDSINDEELILGMLSRYGKQDEYYHEFAGATLYRFVLDPKGDVSADMCDAGFGTWFCTMEGMNRRRLKPGGLFKSGIAFDSVGLRYKGNSSYAYASKTDKKPQIQF